MHDALEDYGPYVLTGFLLLLGNWVWNRIEQKHHADALRHKAAEKRRREQEHITHQLENLQKELDEKEMQAIVSKSASDVMKELKGGNVKPDTVLKAYLYKAFKVTKRLNCVTEAIRECHDVCREIESREGKDMPLYGLPVSLKESLQTKGAPTAMGFVRKLDHPAEEDCVLATVFKHRGAIPFVKTNTPQSMLSYESSNPIYGSTSNPNNPEFGPGGSSSGEGSIIGAGASLLGIGSDAAGSVRVPSHLCGVCGLKPTMNRLSNAGSMGPFAVTALSPTVGPIARDVDTLVTAMRALLCDLMFELDPSCVPIKFRDEIYNSKKPLRIGYYDDDGYVKPIPACQRAVKITKAALEKAGHTLVPFKVPDVQHMAELGGAGFFFDGGRTCLELMDGVVDDCLSGLYKWWKMPRLLRKIHARLASSKSPRIGENIMTIGGGEDASAYRLWNLRGQIEQYKSKFWMQWRDLYKIDALISPAYPLVACPKGSLKNLNGLMTYSVLYNLTNGPAGVVPVTKVNQKDIDDLATYKGHFGDEWDEHNRKACMGSIGMPVAVQCASFPWQEETCLRLMKEVESLLVK